MCIRDRCNALDLDSDGLNALFEAVVNEISELENKGITIALPGKEPLQVYGTIAQFTGDNLGLNKIFGFVECFSGDYNCLIFYATRDQMNTLFHETEFQLRTIQEYEADLSHLAEVSNGFHYRGLKRSCKLNDLKYFQIIENSINDCMHTLFEGVIPYVMGCVLCSVSKINPKLTVESFNGVMHSLFASLIVNRNNKPKEFNSFFR